MRMLFATIFVTVFFAAVPASAQPVNPSYKDTPDHGCTQDMTTDGCFGTGITPGGSGSDKCVKATSYNTCLKRCKCQYDENKQKCKQSPTCLDIAAAEKSACEGGCITDWT